MASGTPDDDPLAAFSSTPEHVAECLKSYDLTALSACALFADRQNTKVAGYYDRAPPLPALSQMGGGTNVLDPKSPKVMRLCLQAMFYEDQCRKSEGNMRNIDMPKEDIDTSGVPPYGQAGAFNNCATLYGKIAAICRREEPSQPTQKASLPDRLSPQASPPPRAPATQLPQNGQSASKVSPACAGIVQNYTNATEAHDSGAALAAYQTMGQSCPDLVQQAVEKSGQPFPERRMGSLTKGLFGACLDNPADCDAARPSTDFAAGGGASGGDVDWNQAANFAAALMGLVGTGLNTAAMMQGGGGGGVPSFKSPNMNSLTGPPIRNGVGQGLPTYRPTPPPRGSDITGIGSH